jgi:hypothetical protein
MIVTSARTSEKKIDIKKTDSVDWDFEFEIGSNKATGTITYTDAFEGWLPRAPKFKSAHPDIPALRLAKIKAKREEGNLIKVVLTYEVTNPEVEYPGREKGTIKRYHMEPGAGEEPLLTNALFKDLDDAEREALQELLSSNRTKEEFAKADSAVTSATGKKAISKIRSGIEAYRNPALVWVERFMTNQLNDVDLPKILKTTNNPPGKCPDAGGDRNWLRMPPTVSPQDDGETWEIENRWELSLRGKWDPDLYPSGG